MNQRTVRELSKSILSSLEEHGVINDRKASSAEITDLAERLSVLFDSRKRISCTDAAEICGTYPGETPEGGWCRFCYDYLRAKNFPQITLPPDTDRYEHGALIFLTILQTLFDYERKLLPFDPVFDFHFLPPETYELCDSADEYKRFLTAFRGEFVYELMRISSEITPFCTLSHIAGVHHIAVTIARAVETRGEKIDIALVSAAAAAHDIGKYGCREGENVPHLHYYYTDYWLETRGMAAISHIASNHSTWDLELDALSAESLCLIYADMRCKSRFENGQEHTVIFSLHDAFDVILHKLENVDAAKRRRYELVYRRLQDFESYLVSLGADIDLSGKLHPLPDLRDPVLLTSDEAVDRLTNLSMEHHLTLMYQLSSERKFGNIIEAAHASRDWKQLRVYLNIIDEYCTYLSVRQKMQALSFLYELLTHREGDIRRQAAQLIGKIIARFHLVYRKSLPQDVPSDPAEEVPYSLWEEYLEKIIRPDHKTTAQQRSQIGFTLHIVIDGLLRNCRTESQSRFVHALLAKYVHPESLDEDTAFTLLDAIRSLSQQYYDEKERSRLIDFAAYFTENGDTRLQTAALLYLREAQRPLPQASEQMRKIVTAVNNVTDSSITLRFLKASILQRAGDRNAEDLTTFYRQEVADDIFLDNLKTATAWVSKIVGIELLKAQAKQGHVDNMLHICTHYSNLVKVSERVVVRQEAGEALLSVLPLLRREQRNEVVVELGKGIELGQTGISKYIPDYLGRAALLLHPSELNEQVIWLKTLLGSSADSTVHGALRTIGVLLQFYGTYRGRFSETQEQYNNRRYELLGLLFQGLAHYREAVRQEALLVIAQLFDGGSLSLSERAELFTLCCRKLLFLLEKAPDTDSLTFFYRASALAHIERFLALYRIDRGSFSFEVPTKVAFFPGTFDPFTLSHKGIVRAIRELGFEVYLAVDEFSWSKKPQPHLIRRQIINMSVAGDFHVHLFPDEIPVNIANPHDLKRLRELFSGFDLYLVAGADVIANASAYKKAPAPYSVHSMNHIIFLRPDQPELPSRENMHLTGNLIELRLPPELEDISSSRIRENVDQNRDISHYIDPAIQDFIYQNGLYLRDRQDKPLLTASEISFEWLTPPYNPTLGLPDEIGKLAAEAKREGEELLLMRRSANCVGAISIRELGTSELFSAVRDAVLANRIRLRAAGKVLFITDFCAEGDDAQLLLSEALAEALAEECVYALFTPRSGFSDDSMDLFARQGFRNREEDLPLLLEADMHAPSVLIRNLETTIQEPLDRDPRVCEAVSRGHARLQRALTGLYPGSLVLTLSSTVIHQRLLERITAFNHVPPVPLTPRVLGECMCVPFGKMLRGRILPNTVTKTIHTDKVYEPDLRSNTIEAFPYYPPIPDQIRTIKSFDRPVILVDDVMHPGNRIRTLDPLFRQEEIDVRMVLVGVLSGRGKDLMKERNRPVDGAYYLPTLREWFVESTLYPFIGGDTVRRAQEPVPGLLPGINHILPYANSLFGTDYPKQSFFELSRCCLESARDVMLALEQAYREQYSRNLTLSRLSEAVILPLCPDKGACLHYDPNLAASVYLENDLEQLLRGAV